MLFTKNLTALLVVQALLNGATLGAPKGLITTTMMTTNDHGPDYGVTVPVTLVCLL